MSIARDVGELPQRLRGHHRKLEALLAKYKIAGVTKLIAMYRFNSTFKAEWTSFWADVIRDEGGKVSLTTIGVILGASLGSIGLAAFGGAVGLPLAALLGLGGFLAGSKVDSESAREGQKQIEISLTHEIYSKLALIAKNQGVGLDLFVEGIVTAYVMSSDEKSSA